MHVEADVVQQVSLGHPLDTQLRLAGGDAMVVGEFGDAVAAEFAAEHLRDQRELVEGGHRPGVHDAAVAQDGDRVAKAVELVEPVAHVDDGDVTPAQLTHGGE